MAKRVIMQPDWLKAVPVEEILSVSSCCSKDFADWIPAWKHNGYWFFDHPSLILDVAHETSSDLKGCRWFYYEGYEFIYDDPAKRWQPYTPEEQLCMAVVPPENAVLRGYDIVTLSSGNDVECSPLSCNSMAEEIPTNRHGLLESFEQAYQSLEQGRLVNSEPGPYGIIAVYEIAAPDLNKQPDTDNAIS